jgi:hypothetical protein
MHRTIVLGLLLAAADCGRERANLRKSPSGILRPR